jgi:exonuclease SbcC
VRPVKLAICAFGPFAGEQVLDFNQLGGRSLFLIHGPTGAGKTTILDAICFALYGITSGQEREAKQMRSDYADPSVPTEVVFDFTLGNDCYRITRRPEHERPKKRGSGMTTVASEATLWQLADFGKASVLASKWSEVTAKVEGLLGFRSDQFCQVRMLPQGQFRQLLLAKSQEREEILEKLFETGFYHLIEEKLKLDARQVKEEHDKMQQQREFILRQAEAETEDALNEQKVAKDVALAEIQGRIDEVRRIEGEALRVLNEAQQIKLKIDEAQEAGQVLEVLETKREEYERKRITLEQSRKAATLAEAEKSLDRQVKDAEAGKTKVGQAEKELNEAHSLQKTAQQNLEKQQSRENVREAAINRLSRMEEMKDKVAQLEDARKTGDEAQGLFTDAKKACDDAQIKLKEYQGKLEEKQAAFDGAEKLAGFLEARKIAKEEAERLYQQRLSLDEARSEFEKSKNIFKEAEAKLKAVEQKLIDSRDEKSVMESAWHEGQAAILAGELAPGTPCPVCGSTEHPYPAVSEIDLPDEAALKKKRSEVKRMEADRDTLYKRLTESQKDMAPKQADVQSLEKNLGEEKEAMLLTLERKLEQVKKVLEEALHADSLLLSLRPEVEILKEQMVTRGNALQKAELELKEKEGQLIRAQAAAEQKASVVPEDLRDSKALAKAAKQMSEEIRALKKALETAQAQAGEANEKVSACKSALAGATDAAKLAGEEVATQTQKFEKSLNEAGFTNRQDFQIAKKALGVMEQLEKDIRQFHGNLISAEDRVKRAQKAAEGLQVPEMEGLQSVAKQAKEKLEKELGHGRDLLNEIKQIEKWMEALEKLARESKEIDAQYFVIGRLSKVANGENAYGMTFQRFVLATLLDDVLTAATTRLRLMSRGRFNLQRVPSRADSRKASGLDLEVYDTWTGTVRLVSTLSGGESFLASLALSLGLADVVQSYAGGIRLDTIFIDEGFGSLDPESLDLAFKALTDIQETGRLVGIVSHVPELKERIDVRLEVIATKRGSSARFVL